MEKLKEHLTMRIDEVLKYYQSIHGIPGMSFGLNIKQNLTLKLSYGFSDVENMTKMSAKTILRVGSLSKPFTCCAILKLQEKGVIRIDQSVQKITSLPPSKKGSSTYEFTLKNIMNHTSGLRDYKNKKEEYYSKTNYPKIIDFLNEYLKDDLANEPGEFNYSTQSYSVLQYIIEKKTGRNFSEILSKDVFRRCNMTSTTLDTPRKIIKKRGRHYQRKGDSLVNAPYVDLSNKFAGGGIMSSIEELLRFGYVFLHQKLITEESMKIMFKVDRKVSNYGLGWFFKEVGDQDQFDVFYHYGQPVGGSAFLCLIPSLSTTMAFMCNLEGVKVAQILNAILDIVVGFLERLPK